MADGKLTADEVRYGFLLGAGTSSSPQYYATSRKAVFVS